ncbi:MAG TPA: LamG-like jellyroll fold domain-containing protein [Polyangiaceae bacterium]
MTAYWPLNEGSGSTAADAAGSGLNLARDVIGGAWDPVLKKFGASALKWSGVVEDGHCFAYRPDTPINMGTVHSAACWVNGWDGTGGVLIGGDGSLNRFFLYVEVDHVFYSNGDVRPVPHGGLSGSHHLCVTRDGPIVRFYKDGVMLPPPDPLTVPTPMECYSIGGFRPFWTGVVKFHGTIDDVRLWNHALSAAQVAELFALNPDASPEPGVSPSTGSSYLINVTMRGQGVSKIELIRAARAAYPGIPVNASLRAYCQAYVDSLAP